MCNRLLALAALALLSACASNPPMDQDAVEGLRAGTVAVAFTYPEKRINYNELVYKVLWNEQRSSTVSFDGIWDIDSDLSEQFARQFRGEGLRAVPLEEVLDDQRYRQIMAAVGAYHPSIPESELTVSDDIRAALRDRGVDYLIAVRAANLHVEAFSFGVNPRLTLSYRMNVIDLARNEIAYSGPFWIGASPEVAKSAREIEDDNLAKLRAVLSEGLSASFASGVVPKQLGMVANAE